MVPDTATDVILSKVPPVAEPSSPVLADYNRQINEKASPKRLERKREVTPVVQFICLFVEVVSWFSLHTGSLKELIQQEDRS